MCATAKLQRSSQFGATLFASQLIKTCSLASVYIVSNHLEEFGRNRTAGSCRGCRQRICCGILAGLMTSMDEHKPSIPPAAGHKWQSMFWDDFTGTGYTLDENFRHPMGKAKWKWDADSNKEIHWEPACSSIVEDASSGKSILRVSVWSDWFHRIDRLATKQQFGYGYYESRCRFQGASGMHSAFWLLPEAMVSDFVPPGEIVGGIEVDLVEHRAKNGEGSDISKHGSTAVHWGGYGANHHSSAYKLVDLPADPSAWATFGVLHQPGGLKWYWNGNEVHSVAVWSPMSNYMFFSTEVNESTGWAGPDLSSYGPIENPAGYIEIDYCGFWESVAYQLSESPDSCIDPTMPTSLSIRVPGPAPVDQEQATPHSVSHTCLAEVEARQLHAKVREVEEQSRETANQLQERIDFLEHRLATELSKLKELVQNLVSTT